MWDKVPQAVNLNTPATLFIGRDGKVKANYSGFATAARGVYNKELKDDFISNIERLLAGESVQSTASIAPPGLEPGAPPCDDESASFGPLPLLG